MDVLNTLRNCIKKSLTIELKDNKIYLDNIPYELSTSLPIKSDKGYHTLYDIYLFYKALGKDGKTNTATYVSSLNGTGCDLVTTLRQKSISEYLLGKTEDCDSLDTFFTPKQSNDNKQINESTSSLKRTKDKQFESILVSEINSKSRDNIIKHKYSTDFFTPIFRMLSEQFSNPKTSSESNKRPISTTTTSGFNIHDTKRTQLDPNHEYYILLPPFRNNAITMYNVEQFLINTQYINSDKLRNNNEKKRDIINIQYTYNNNIYKFKCIDNYSQLKPEAWKDVVCVICGQNEWQFKPFPEKDIASIFNNHLGIYFGYPDAPLPSTVSKWNVKRLDISPDNRSQDSIVRIKFWEYVIDFLHKKYNL